MGKSIEKLETVTRVDVDLAKSAIQLRAADAQGEIVVARAFRPKTCSRLDHPRSWAALAGAGEKLDGDLWEGTITVIQRFAGRQTAEAHGEVSG